MYLKETVPLYDEIYSRIKDYADEAEKIRACIRLIHPAAQSILDVACGTAEHARHLKKDFSIDGLDLSGDFLEVAQRKNPECRYFQGDMRNFQLHSRYDVVMSLFSSIGYVLTEENLVSTLRCFARHLNPGGAVIVEPWLTPEAWTPGKIHMVTVNEPEFKLCRMGRNETRAAHSFFTWEFLVARPGELRHFTEEHTLGLFTVDQMKRAFSEAGLIVEHDSKGIFGRGLYLARRMSP